jgi:purine-nucleoside phosphorylase
MLEIHDKIRETVAVISRQWDRRPRAGIILGTGLGGLVDELAVDLAIDYRELPHFLQSTVASHRGRLICGTLAGVPVVVMEGRFHAYEGYDLAQITFPVRVMRSLGAELLIVSNAVGGMNPHFQTGDLMVIEDHINLIGHNPLVGINDDRLGPRFPDMSAPYDLSLVDRARTIARRHDIALHPGVLVAVLGPNLETRAEYRFLRLIGADAVGMSTVPEVIVAVHCGMKVVGFSVITDMCLPDALKPANLEEIIAVAQSAEPRLRTMVRETLRSWAEVRVA